MADELVARTEVPEIKEPVLAVVSPHAGYPYSGPVAAYSYAVLKGRKFACVVVISPSHFEGFSFASVYQGDAYATSPGNIPLDKLFAAQLAESNPLIKLSTAATATLRVAENIHWKLNSRSWSACCATSSLYLS